MPIVRLVDYPDLPRPSLNWVIHRLLPRPGTVVLLGPPKEGKSSLALSIAQAVAHGTPFLGQQAVVGPVLYLYLDAGEAIWRERIKDLREITDLTGPIYLPDPESIPYPFNILEQRTQLFARELIAEVQPALVIIDVFRDFHNADEDKSTPMKAINDIMGSLFRSCSLLLLHHTKKLPTDFHTLSEQDRRRVVMTLSRGSSAITGRADAVWLLAESKLTMVSRWDEDVTHAMTMNDSGLWVFTEEKRREEAAGRCRSLCAEFPGLTHNELAKVAKERWGLSRAAYYRHIAGHPCSHVKPPAA